MNAPLPSLEAFRAEWLGQGYDEVLAREWAPGQLVQEHRHPFDVQALVVRGSLVLGCAGEQRTLQAGDRFPAWCWAAPASSARCRPVIASQPGAGLRRRAAHAAGR